MFRLSFCGVEISSQIEAMLLIKNDQIMELPAQASSKISERRTNIAML